MKIVKLTFSYLDRMNIFAFIAAVRLIINKLKALPPVLQSPNPSIATMEGQLAITEQAAEKAKFGDRNLIHLRDDERAILMAMTVQQGGTAVGSDLTPVQLEGLGFRLSKEPQPAPPIGAPQDLRAVPTSVNHGAEITWRRTKYAYGFQLQKTQQSPSDPNVIWEDVLFTNRSKVTLENVAPAYTTVWFRVVGFSSQGQSPYSDPVMFVVL